MAFVANDIAGYEPGAALERFDVIADVGCLVRCEAWDGKDVTVAAVAGDLLRGQRIAHIRHVGKLNVTPMYNLGATVSAFC